MPPIKLRWGSENLIGLLLGAKDPNKATKQVVVRELGEPILWWKRGPEMRSLGVRSLQMSEATMQDKWKPLTSSLLLLLPSASLRSGSSAGSSKGEGGRGPGAPKARSPREMRVQVYMLWEKTSCRISSQNSSTKLKNSTRSLSLRGSAGEVE